MALDTAAKRSSAVFPGSPWRGVLPFPDGTIGQGDRQAAAMLYSGVLAGEPDEPIVVSVVGPGFWSEGFVFIPGFKAGQIYVPGFKEGSVFVPGYKSGQKK